MYDDVKRKRTRVRCCGSDACTNQHWTWNVHARRRGLYTCTMVWINKLCEGVNHTRVRVWIVHTYDDVKYNTRTTVGGVHVYDGAKLYVMNQYTWMMVWINVLYGVNRTLVWRCESYTCMMMWNVHVRLYVSRTRVRCCGSYTCMMVLWCESICTLNVWSIVHVRCCGSYTCMMLWISALY